jgi:bifunctional UDP-N-acetylglucosamine pyrophosphorylase/glucosamine-1-phosphate N-acetyltransferase
MKLSVIVLGAGLGSRMKSSKPKAMQKLGGYTMMEHLIFKAQSLNADEIICVIGQEMQELEELIKDKVKIAYQKDRLGSAHAVLSAKSKLENKDGLVLILYVDTPLLQVEKLNQLLDLIKKDKKLAILAFEELNENSYGRLVVKDGNVLKIVETAEASLEEKKITLCNSGVMALNAKYIWEILEKINNNNKKQEFYLTDALEIATNLNYSSGYIIDDIKNLMGANTKFELELLENHFQNLQREKFLNMGVQLIDKSTTYFSLDTLIGKDVVIYPNVFIGPKVVIGDNVSILPSCVLEGATIGDNVNIGPFARLRPQSVLHDNVHIGNFVEIKKSTIEKGAKVNHLTYIGDAFVGEKTNIGAGTITCNYDGVNKHQTKIGKNTFIGSNTLLVAPVEVGDGATTGAGSVITKNVPNNSLGIARAKQIHIENWQKK